LDEKSKETAKHAKRKKENDIITRFKDWFAGLRGEFLKIIWPSRKELIKQTTTVIIMSLVVGGVVVIFNFIYFNGLSLLSAFLPK
jgi:preprotein translocase subunit SecE